MRGEKLGVGGQQEYSTISRGYGHPSSHPRGFLVRVPLPVQVLGVFPLILIGMGQSWLSGDTQT